MSLENLKSKYYTLTEKITKLKFDNDDLMKKYDEVIRTKIELEEKFTVITNEIKQISEKENVVLSSKLQSLQDQLDAKEAQLSQIIDNANLDPSTYQDMLQKI